MNQSKQQNRKLMKSKITLVVLLALFAITTINAQSNSPGGKVLESLSMKSTILTHEIKYSVYLPSGYETSSRAYPVLYLLHGSGDDETSWIQFGNVVATADKLMANSQATPMVIVMPDAGLSGYINSYDNKECYEDAFFNEFIPTIEKTYRIRSSKEFRAIAGNSMGGYGSLHCSLTHPEMFAACMPFSQGNSRDTLVKLLQIQVEKNLNAGYADLKLDSLPEKYKMNSNLYLAQTLLVEQLNSVKFYFDMGDKDERIFGVLQLNQILNQRNVAHELRVREGDHNWSYWRQSIEDGLKFLTSVFVNN